MKRFQLAILALAAIAPGIFLLGQTQPAPTAAPKPATQTAPAAPATPPIPPIPKDWKLYTAGTAFTFQAPPDLKEEKLQGIDSFVGKYTSPAMTIFFDYGWYSNELNDPKFKREPIVIDGRDAFLATWDGGAGVYVPMVGPTKGLPNSPIRLEFTIDCGKDSAPQAILLLRSIKFLEPVGPR